MKHYKVFIADDTPLIREALIKSIPWERLGCIIAGEAEDGLKAKDMIDKIRPEILIADIRMPGLDGLALTEYSNRILPDSKVIIITGFQEFEYARRALQLNVKDFLLKPLNNDYVMRVVAETVQELRQQEKRAEYEKKLLQENADYQTKVRSSMRAIQGKILSDLFLGRGNSGEYSKEYLKEMGLAGVHIQVLGARVRSSDEQMSTAVWNQIIFYMYEYEKAKNVRVLEVRNGKDILFFVLDKEKKSSRSHKIYMKNQIIYMNRQLRNELLPEICACIGNVTNQLEKAVECGRQVMEVLEYNFFMTKEEILEVENYQLLKGKKSSYRIPDFDKLFLALEASDRENIRGEVQKLVEDIARGTGGNLFQIKCLLSELCITVLRHYNQKGKDEKITKLIDEIDNLVNLEAAGAYVNEFMDEIRKDLKQERVQYNPLVQDAIKYIQENYGKDISLTMVADFLAVNPSYLSRLLKQETGENFTDILMDIRIRRAKQLLHEPGVRITDITELVGYNNYEYFFQVFRKSEGISPSEYRRQIKQ